MKLSGLIVTLVTFFLATGCDRPYRTEDTWSQFYASSPYNLSNPDGIHRLHFDLREISGLSYYSPDRLAAVQDESGRLFLIDLKSGEITRSIKFHKSGDYEGVEIVDNVAYLVKSNGKIYSFSLTEKDEVEAREIETPLGIANDIEGLGYDPQSQNLLLACKANGGLKKSDVKGKAIYQFSLAEGRLLEIPMAVRKNDIKDFAESQNLQWDRKIDFGPSGVAVHPISQTYYVLSHVGKLLIEIANSGEILNVYPLNPRIFRQPEGICFAPNGDLYISNEGAGSRGTILEFKHKKVD